MDIIILDGICKKYGNKTVLNNFSAKFEEGDFAVITGESGSGKSTLLNIVGLLEKCDKGNYTVCGIENPRLGSKQSTQLLRNNIAYLFQNFALVSNQTVKQNLKVATHFINESKSQIDIRIEDALKKVGLPDFEDKIVGQLSGGEQQRVALARVMLKPGQIVLADEPTGSLDSRNRDHVMEIIKEMNSKGKTIIIVTHDKEVVKYANKVIQL